MAKSCKEMEQLEKLLDGSRGSPYKREILEELKRALSEESVSLEHQSSKPEIRRAILKENDAPGKRARSSECSLQRCSSDELARSTAQAAQKMTPEERQRILLMRKLRNRESARRSRMKADITIDLLKTYRDQLRACLAKERQSQ